jgi:hypothetical protein
MPIKLERERYWILTGGRKRKIRPGNRGAVEMSGKYEVKYARDTAVGVIERNALVINLMILSSSSPSSS